MQGYSGFTPPSHQAVRATFTSPLPRPDGTLVEEVSYVNAHTIGLLQDLGVRYLVLNRRGYRPEDWPAVIAQLEATGQVEPAATFTTASIYRVTPPPTPPSPVTLAALYAPTLAVPQKPWDPVLVVNNPQARWALLYARQAYKLSLTWRDEHGRLVRRDERSFPLPTIVPPGEIVCSPWRCASAQGYAVPLADPGPGGTRLTPARPGRYSVHLAVRGDQTLERTLAVEVAQAPPPASVDGPALAFRRATAVTTELARGGAAILTLDWEARRSPPADYTIAAQLVGPDGQVWGQHDALAGWLSHYTSAWLPGEQVSLYWWVPLQPGAPPGRYRLRIEVYQRGAAGVERVAVRYPDGEATEHWAGEFTVR